MRPLSLSLILASLPCSLLADAWEASIQRGFETYAATGEGGSVTLVCDPDRIHNPSVSHASFVVALKADPTAKNVVFLGANGLQAHFTVRDGIATQNEAPAEQWEKLIGLVATGGQFAIVTSRTSMTLTLDAPANFRCS